MYLNFILAFCEVAFCLDYQAKQGENYTFTFIYDIDLWKKFNKTIKANIELQF